MVSKINGCYQEIILDRQPSWSSFPSMNNIPPELLQKILDYLNTGSISVVRGVCKYWHANAIELLKRRELTIEKAITRKALDHWRECLKEITFFRKHLFKKIVEFFGDEKKMKDLLKKYNVKIPFILDDELKNVNVFGYLIFAARCKKISKFYKDYIRKERLMGSQIIKNNSPYLMDPKFESFLNFTELYVNEKLQLTKRSMKPYKCLLSNSFKKIINRPDEFIQNIHDLMFDVSKDIFLGSKADFIESICIELIKQHKIDEAFKLAEIAKGVTKSIQCNLVFILFQMCSFDDDLIKKVKIRHWNYLENLYDKLKNYNNNYCLEFILKVKDDVSCKLNKMNKKEYDEYKFIKLEACLLEIKFRIGMIEDLFKIHQNCQNKKVRKNILNNIELELFNLKNCINYFSNHSIKHKLTHNYRGRMRKDKESFNLLSNQLKSLNQ